MVSTRANIITRRTYNRPLNAEGTKFETWGQTVNRVVDHQRWLWERALTHKERPGLKLHNITEDMEDWVHLEDAQEEELDKLRQLMLDRKVSLAGRSLWLGNTWVAKNREISQFNCSSLQIKTVYDIVDAFWALLNGAGVGFKPVPGILTGFSSRVESVKFIDSERSGEDKGSEANREEWDERAKIVTYIVGDSAEAWAKFMGKIIAHKHPAKHIIVDFSEIRGAGTRLRNYGWISQGFIGLKSATDKIIKILNKNIDNLLSAIDILDVANLLGTVLSTRRAAQISLYDYKDSEWNEFALAKKDMFNKGNEHRAQSNNTLLFKQKPSKEELSKILYMMDEGGNGEPGIANYTAMKARAPWSGLMNPCISAEAPLITKKGIRKLKDISTGDKIWSEDGWTTITKKVNSGVKNVYKFSTTAGTFYSTPEHRIKYKGNKIEVQDAVGIDTLLAHEASDIKEDWQVILAGLVFGEGDLKDKEYYDTPLENFSTNKYESTEESDTLETHYKRIPDKILYANNNVKANFLKGLYSANGSVLKKKKRVTFKTVSKGLVEDVQLMLSSLGIQSYYTINKATKVKLSSEEYVYTKNYEINISTYRVEFKNIIGFIHKHKQAKLKDICKGYIRTKTKETFDVINVEDMGEMEVFDITVSGPSHTYWCYGFNTSNCGEILLPEHGAGLCCLVTIDLGKFKENNLELWEAGRIISRANYRQTIVDLDDGVLQETWTLNNNYLHLQGVSLMGVVKRPDMKPYDYKRLERIVTEASYGMAKELDLPISKNITTQKPEGSISKCFDSTEGMHKPLGKYILNNVAFSKYDPLVERLQEANYKVIRHPYDNSAMLVTLPVEYDDVEFDLVDGKYVNLETALDQLERYKMLMNSWCHQNVSCTISYDTEELESIVDWVYNNWDNYVAVSFLKRNDPTKTAKDLGYPYLPQEVVTKETYIEYVSKLKEFDIDEVNSLEEIQEDDCAGGACPIR